MAPKIGRLTKNGGELTGMIFDQEMIGLVTIYDVLMSCTRSSYNPWFPERVKISTLSDMQECYVSPLQGWETLF